MGGKGSTRWNGHRSKPIEERQKSIEIGAYVRAKGIATGAETGPGGVRLSWSPCHYGGSRPWFVCPTRECGRRVRKLYAAGTSLHCRTCLGLAYRTQRMNQEDRLRHRARKRRWAIGNQDPGGTLLAWKPANMHWTTFARIAADIKWTEEEAWALSLCRVHGPHPDFRESVRINRLYRRQLRRNHLPTHPRRASRKYPYGWIPQR